MNCNCFGEFTGQMTVLRDSLLEGITNLPNMRSLILRTRQYVDTSSEPQYSYTIITPAPIITLAYPRLEGLDGVRSLKLATGNFQVKGVSKAYTRDLLEAAGTEYFVGASLEKDGVVGGVICELDSLVEQTLTWEITLKRKIGEQLLY